MIRTPSGPALRWGAVLLVIAWLTVTCGLPGAALTPMPSPGAPEAPAASPSAGASGAVPESEAPEADAPHIVLEEVTTWLDGEGTLRVVGRLNNPGEEAIEAPALTLSMSTSRLGSRSAINVWKESLGSHRTLATSVAAGAPADDADADPDADDGDEEPEEVVPRMPERVDGGASVPFEFEIPADDLELGSTDPLASWGARGLAVQLDGSNAAGPVSAVEPAFTTWNPDAQTDPTRISMIMPVTISGFSTDGLIPADRLEQSALDGELASLREALAVDDSLSLAVDPRLLASIEHALTLEPEEDDDAEAPPPPETTAPADDADDFTAAPAEGPDPAPQLREWFADFADSAEGRSVFALPWADADLSALRSAGLDELADRAADQTSYVTELLPDARSTIAWPVSGTVDGDTLADAVGEDAESVIVSDLQQPSLAGYTANAHSSIDLSGDGSGEASALQSLVVDTGLSEAAAEASRSGETAAAMSEYIAESSAITAERPYDSRHLLVVLPRTGAVPAWQRLAAATASAPWLELRSLDSLLDTQPVARTPIVEPTRAAGLPTTGLDAIADAREKGDGFADVFTEPSLARTDLERMLLACTSASWADATNYEECIGALTDRVDAVTGSIRPDDSSPVLLVTGEETTIPVLVRNEGTRPAAVSVRIAPRTPQLRTEESEIVELAAGGTTRVDVPVEGLANGDVDASVELVAANGHVLPASGDVLVRVRADWENIGTAVVGAGLLAVFVVGLWKSVSRGRRKIPQSQLDAAVAQVNEPGSR